MNKTRARNTAISVFVVLWLALFHYESLWYFYLAPWAKKHFDVELSGVQWLYPPAGWIMFFQVGDRGVYTQVYGIKDGQPQPLDPHDIIPVRTIMYDNIHRNVLSDVLSANRAQPFCSYLKGKFNYFDEFWVTAVEYPQVTEEPFRRYQKVMYQCR